MLMMVLSRGYQERLDQYFLASDIDDGKKVPALLSLVGASAYRLLRDIFSPDLPSTKDFPTLCDKLKTHYAREPLIIAERFTSRKHLRTKVTPGFHLTYSNKSCRMTA